VGTLLSRHLPLYEATAEEAKTGVGT